MDFEKDNSSEEEAEEPIINKEKNISDEQMDVTSVTDENMDENEQEPKEQDPEEAFEQLANGADLLSAGIKFTDELVDHIIGNILQKSLTTACKAMRIIERIATTGILLNELIAGADRLIARLKSDFNLEFEEVSQNSLLNLLLLRCEEERFNFKKSAILAIQALVLAIPTPDAVNAAIEKLSKKCRDLALAIRKLAAQSLTRLLHSLPQQEKLQNAWLHSVMHQIIDREPSVQQGCAKLFLDVIIDPIIHNSQGVVWSLIAAIEKEADLKRLLIRCLDFLHREKNLSQRLIQVLEDKIRLNENSNACWMLLAELSAFLEVSTILAVEKLARDVDLSAPDPLIAYMAKLIANRSSKKNMSFQQRNLIKSEISQALLSYKVHSSCIAPAYFAYAKIVNGIGPESPGYQELTNFDRGFFTQCLRDLDELVYSDSPSQETDRSSQSKSRATQPLSGSQEQNCDKIIRIIASIGECIQYTPALINKEVFKLLQVIIPSDVLKKLHHQHQRSAPNTPIPHAISPNTSFATELPESQSQSQQSLSSNGRITGTTTFFNMRYRQRTIRAELLTRHVRAYAVLTLGKLCLFDEQLSKKCIPVFIRELKNNKDHIVRNNIVIVVCDLCIRHTSLVDRYSAILASCLWDRSVLVRHHTLLMLTNLLKEQYLKWEGTMIYRYVTALFDADAGIKAYADFCLTEILFPHFREELFFHRFIECIFIFNGVKHIVKIDFDLSNQVDQKCSLEGRNKRESRMFLYKYMLKTFADDQKIKILEKIGYDIFLPIVEGSFKLDDVKVRSLLYDSFRILRSKNMKLSLQLGKRSVDDEVEDDDPPEAIQKAAKRAIGATFRKSIVELVMPRLLAIRGFLLEKRSPMANECHAAIFEICKNHAEYVDEFLASDPQLKAEVKFDLKKLNNQGQRDEDADEALEAEQDENRI